MKPVVEKCLHLRILVAGLGEGHHCKWWRSTFLSSTGVSFLERITPRSNFATAVRSAAHSAQLVHDSSIGKGQVYHLFRLPNDWEFEVEETLQTRAGEYENLYKPLLNNRPELMQMLSTYTGGISPTNVISGETRGPMLVSFHNGDLTKHLAALYLLAFRQENQVFPYFADGEA